MHPGYVNAFVKGDPVSYTHLDVYKRQVQHLESLNDRVRDITGVQVRETVPDWVLQEADEIQLVDLPPRELLERLRDGKVYMPRCV